MGTVIKQMSKTKVKNKEIVEMEIKKQLQKAFSEGYNQGFSEGAKDQHEADAKSLIDFFINLEKVNGIGEKTAWKVREAFMELANKK